MSVKDLPQQHSRKKEPPPIEWLKTQLSYDPETGDFSWLCKKQGRGLGKAGHLDKDGYFRTAMRYNNQKHDLQLARVAFALMVGRWPICIDHINGNRTDNRWFNIREVSQAENSKNQKVYKNNTSGVPGVRWIKDKNKWGSRIRHAGKVHSLGHYQCFFEAVCAKKSAELRYGFHENHGRP